MRIALLGSSGMLGSKFRETALSAGHDLLAPSHAELDVTDGKAVEKFFSSNSFEVLVNCAGFTRVDDCEKKENAETATRLNGEAPGFLARECKRTGRTLVHFSTDYVFDGLKKEPYREDDKTGPLNAYGTTKLEGEKRIQVEGASSIIIRSSWLYGPGGPNFVKTMVELLKTKPRLEVVDDQVGGPTYTTDLARFALELLEKKAATGVYHFANAGYTSWNGFAKEIQRVTGLTSCELVPVTSAQVVRPAKRPLNSRFDLSKGQGAVGHASRNWQDALKEYLTKDFDGSY